MSINLYAFTKITPKLSVSLKCTRKSIVSFIANLLVQPMNIHACNFQQKMYSILSEISKESSPILECTLNGYEFVEIGDHPLLHTTFTRCHQVWITTKPQKSFQQSNEERAKMLMYPHRYVFVCFDSIYWLMNLMQCTLAQHA